MNNMHININTGGKVLSNILQSWISFRGLISTTGEITELVRMNFKEKLRNLFDAIDRKYSEQFGFHLKETTFMKIVEYLHDQKHASSLAVTRILFGLCMLFDIPHERGGASMLQRWGGTTCHFPLIPFILAIPMPYMAIVYLGLWIGALGIMLGYKYRIASKMFVVFYWYLFLIEKSFWNNHSYLFGLVGFLLTFTEAHCYWSIDAYLYPNESKTTVPYWNYFLLKYQFFILYFMAGVKKGTAEWLTGYSVQRLAEHWVFAPFKIFLTVSQIDYLIVHWFIFVFDLTVAIWMTWARTRHIAMVLCAMFHLMNSRLFSIGMFPWVCLATMPLFYPFDWPETTLSAIKEIYHKIYSTITGFITFQINNTCDCDQEFELTNENDMGDDEVFSYDDPNPGPSDNKKAEAAINKKSENYSANQCTGSKDTEEIFSENNDSEDDPIKSDANKRKKNTTCLIILYVLMQLFLPFSHFITKGYNNWTDGLYGYSWDMMVHTWDTQIVVVKVVDNEKGQEYYVEPSRFALTDRWTRHGDMVYQYAHCLKDNLIKERKRFETPTISENISIYIDVWCSMNGRFTQRLFDSKVDLIQAQWSPFSRVSFLMPLLDEAVHWRSKLEKIAEELNAWNNNSNVIFFAEFPYYDQEKFIPIELSNVTLTILEGTVVYEPEVTKLRNGQSLSLKKDDKVYVQPGIFHKVINIGANPAYYMYTFTNTTKTNSDEIKIIKAKLPLINELIIRFKGMIIFASIVLHNLFKIMFGCNGNC